MVVVVVEAVGPDVVVVVEMPVIVVNVEFCPAVTVMFIGGATIELKLEIKVTKSPSVLEVLAVWILVALLAVVAVAAVIVTEAENVVVAVVAVVAVAEVIVI